MVSINIKNKEAERLLAGIKARTGKGTSAIMLELLQREHERLEQANEREGADALESMRALQEAWRKLPLVDRRSPDEILDYDEHGLPR